MSVSRRNFLKTTAAGLSAGFVGLTVDGIMGAPHEVQAASVPQLSTTGAATAASRSSFNYLHRATYEAFLNSSFQVRHDNSETSKLRLIEVCGHCDMPVVGSSEADRDHFSLVFHAADQLPASQDTYRLQHPRLGKFDLFLVTAGQDKKGYRYRAIINRLHA